MAYMEWSENYATGIRMIDNDHRELFDIVNLLAEHVKDDIDSIHLSQITERLDRYVKEHFQREEKLMRDYAYPGLAAHHIKHAEFVKVIEAIRIIEHNCPEKLDADKFLLYLSRWLRLHIMGTDREYLPYLTGNYADGKFDKARVDGDGSGGKSERASIVSLTLDVPADDVDTMQKCAVALKTNPRIAECIRNIVQPLYAVTVEEALELAEPILRK